MNPLTEKLLAKTAEPINGVIDERMDSFGLDLTILEPILIPFSFGGKHYVLQEAPSDAVVKWRNAQLNATKLVDGKAAGFVNMADCEPLLVSLCLFFSTGPKSVEVLMGGQKNNIPQSPGLSVIRSWPYRVQKKLYDKIMEISGLEADNPVKDSLLAALSRNDSPVSLDIFRVYVGSLKAEDEKKYELLYSLISQNPSSNGGFSPKGHSISTEDTSTQPVD